MTSIRNGPHGKGIIGGEKIRAHTEIVVLREKDGEGEPATTEVTYLFIKVKNLTTSVRAV